MPCLTRVHVKQVTSAFSSGTGPGAAVSDHGGAPLRHLPWPSQMLRRLRIENLVLIHEAELSFAPGLNAITGETGAGKTILAQAIGLLLGAKGDAAYIGPDGDEAYVEAELDLPPALLDEEELASLAELRPQDEDGLVLARRVFADGRTRAYAWGRAAAREDIAAVGGEADRDVRAIRTAPPRTDVLPAGSARLVRRRGATAATCGSTPRLAGAGGGTKAARGTAGGSGRRGFTPLGACARSSRTRPGWSPGRNRTSARSGSVCAT